MAKVNFRATPVPEAGGEGTSKNERRFRASVEDAFGSFDRAMEVLNRQFIEFSTARWAEITFDDITLTDAWQDLVVDTVIHSNLKGQAVYRVDVEMLADGSNANSEVQVRALVDTDVVGTSQIIIIGNRVDQKLDFHLFFAASPLVDFDLEVRGLNADIRAVRASFTRIGYEETM